MYRVGFLVFFLFSFSSLALARFLSFKPTFRIRSESSQRTNFSSTRNFSLLRIRLKGGWEEGPVYLGFTPQLAKVWGGIFWLPSGTEQNQFQSSSGSAYDPPLWVHEGYLRYSATSYMTFWLGRQVFSYGDDLVLGALNWNNISRSFDAFKVRIRPGSFYWIDFFISKLAESDASSLMESELMGFYGRVQLYWLKQADLYFLYRPTKSEVVTEIYALGYRLLYDLESFSLRLEGTFEWGNGVGSKGFQVDGDIGYVFYPFFKLVLGGFLATANYDQLYSTAHKWLGTADVVGRRNLVGGRVKVISNWSTFFKTTLALFSFYRYTLGSPVFKVDGSSPLGVATGSDSKEIGVEFDFIMGWRLDRYIDLEGGVGYFVSGRYLRDQFGSFNPSFYYFQLVSRL